MDVWVQYINWLCVLKIVAYDSTWMKQLSCHNVEQCSSSFANAPLQIPRQYADSSAEQLGFVCLGDKAPPQLPLPTSSTSSAITPIKLQWKHLDALAIKSKPQPVVAVRYQRDFECINIAGTSRHKRTIQCSVRFSSARTEAHVWKSDNLDRRIF